MPLIDRDEQLEIARRHAPLLWFHEDDAFLPEDVSVMAQHARLRGRTGRTRPVELDKLSALRDSRRWHMEIPALDFPNFGAAADGTERLAGPHTLADQARRLLGNARQAAGPGRAAPRYYARVYDLRVPATLGDGFEDLDDARLRRQLGAGLEGRYRVVQYWFFFAYNDAANQHVGDWDATLELYLHREGGPSFAVHHLHETRWATRFEPRKTGLKRWIADWRRIASSKTLGHTYSVDGHPFVFVSRGGHGGYPTPGYALHGASFLGVKFPYQTDVRRLGGLVAGPFDRPGLRAAVDGRLDAAGLACEPEYRTWLEPRILEHDCRGWLEYRGLWGDPSPYKGWAGPVGPRWKEYWKKSAVRFRRTVLANARGVYSGAAPIKILRSHHGF